MSHTMHCTPDCHACVCLYMYVYVVFAIVVVTSVVDVDFVRLLQFLFFFVQRLFLTMHLLCAFVFVVLPVVGVVSYVVDVIVNIVIVVIVVVLLSSVAEGVAIVSCC